MILGETFNAVNASSPLDRVNTPENKDKIRAESDAVTCKGISWAKIGEKLKYGPSKSPR